MQTNTSNELFDIRDDYTGELISQHTSRDDAEDTFGKIPYGFRQDCTIWKHIEGAPDHAYLNRPPTFDSEPPIKG